MAMGLVGLVEAASMAIGLVGLVKEAASIAMGLVGLVKAAVAALLSLLSSRFLFSLRFSCLRAFSS